MSAPQPPTKAPTDGETVQYERMKHNVSWAMVVVCPLIMAIPPRKLDLYTFALGGATVVSANQLTRERTGKSIIQYLSSRSTKHNFPTERAEEVHERLKREKLLRGQPAGQGDERTLLQRVWMGGEQPGWKEQRIQEEKEALEDGRGYQGLIVDQIKQVFKGKDSKEDEQEIGEERKTSSDEKQR